MKFIVAYSIGLLTGLGWVNADLLHPIATLRPSHFLEVNLTSPKPQSSPDLLLKPKSQVMDDELRHKLELQGTPICRNQTCWSAPKW